jgi:hypothetical protein
LATAPIKSPDFADRGSQSEEIRFEHEGIIREVFGGQLRCNRHHFQGIDLNRRWAGNRALMVQGVTAKSGKG